MYPTKLVHKLINKYTSNGNTIYDPFSGRGTTLLEARFLKRKVYASDLNPLSFVLTKAKSYTLNKNQIIKTIVKYEQMYHTYKVKIDKKRFWLYENIFFQKTFINKIILINLCSKIYNSN